MDILNAQNGATTEEIDITQGDEEITQEEVIEAFAVDETDEAAAETFEAFPALGTSNEQLRHSLLNCRDVPDQHPIVAITGLREELNEIEALGIVYSDKIGQANYYLWNDANPLEENRIGLFVAICRDTDCIKIASESDDIFGVTVDSAGFTGGQSDIERDTAYGLVAHTGLVRVMCEIPVSEGDYIVSNAYGYGTKAEGDYGCKVIDVQNVNGTICAIISLGTNDSKIYNLSQGVSAMSKRLDNAEINVIAATNTANEAHRLVKNIDFENLSNKINEEIGQIQDQTNSIVDTVDNIQSSTQTALEVSNQAKAIAMSAANSAENMRNEAIATSNEALSEVNSLTRTLEPLTTWTDAQTGNSGAEYLVNYINNGLSTKSEVLKAETDSQSAISLVQKNAKEMQSLVATIDKYSVGERSQADGLTKEQAQGILEPGMLYIPTEEHDESSYCDEARYFSRGYCYTWDGTKWIESESPSVIFSASYVYGSDVFVYWYTDTDEDIVVDDLTYDKHTLYLWKYDRWNAVATLSGNVNNRVNSIIKQDVDSITAEITNAYGAVSGFGAKLSETNTKVNSIASWPLNDGKTHRLATIEEYADGEHSYLVLAAGTKEDGTPELLSGAKIILNDSELGSYITLDADRIDFKGGTVKFDAANIDFESDNYTISADRIVLSGGVSFTTIDTESGNTMINGASIATGSITADQIDVTNLKVNAANIDGILTIGQLPSDVATTGDITTITNDTISTTNVVAQNLKVNAINIDGTLVTAQIDTGAITVDKLASDVIELTKSLTVLDGNSNTLFHAGGNTVKIAGWTADNNSLFSGDTFSSSDAFICTGSASNFTIAGHTGNGWVFKAGSNFGVTKTGNLYASNAELSGKITATSGAIGEWNIGSVTIPTPTTNINLDKALYSNEVYDSDSQMTYQVALTPTRVYLWGQDSLGAYYDYSTWHKIIIAANN